MVKKTAINGYGYWQQYDNCYAAAKRCETASDYERQYPQAYRVSRKNDWQKDYTWFKSGFERAGRIRTKWTYETCAEESRKYKTISEFQAGSVGAYQKALRKGWLGEYDWLQRGLDLYGAPDCVYKYEFTEYHAVYVGRTINKADRHYAHVFNTYKDIVAKFAAEKNIPVPDMVVLADNLTLEEGRELEDIWRNYFIEQGFDVLNKAKTGKNKGSIGSIGWGKWNYDTCYQEALKYHSRKEFQDGCVSAYTRALQYRWLDDYSWFETAKTGRTKWTEKRCYEEAQKYCYMEDFLNLSSVAYTKAKKKGWLEDYVWLGKKSRMKTIPQSVLFWTKERCYEEAKKYKSRTEFEYAKGASSAYRIAVKNGWIEEYEWMAPKSKPHGYWNDYDRCFEEAKKYKTRSEFQYAKGASRAYKTAVQNGWIDDYTWFQPKKKQSGYWTKERCEAEARKYTSSSQFKKNSGSAYTIALRNGWYDDYIWLNSRRGRNNEKHID